MVDLDFLVDPGLGPSRPMDAPHLEVSGNIPHPDCQA